MPSPFLLIQAWCFYMQHAGCFLIPLVLSFGFNVAFRYWLVISEWYVFFFKIAKGTHSRSAVSLLVSWKPDMTWNPAKLNLNALHCSNNPFELELHQWWILLANSRTKLQECSWWIGINDITVCCTVRNNICGYLKPIQFHTKRSCTCINTFYEAHTWTDQRVSSAGCRLRPICVEAGEKLNELSTSKYSWSSTAW